jgi:hypothetical protein
MVTSKEAVGGAAKKPTVLKDITNDGKEASARRAVPPRKVEAVPSAAPLATAVVATRVLPAKKPVAVSGQPPTAATATAEVNVEKGIRRGEAPACLALEEQGDAAVDQAAPDSDLHDMIDHLDTVDQRPVVTPAHVTGAGGSPSPKQRNKTLCFKLFPAHHPCPSTRFTPSST